MDDSGRPLRIAYCVDSLSPGGTELNAVRTAERIQRTGAEVQLLVLGPDGPLLARYERLEIPVIRFRLTGFMQPSTGVRALGLARHLVRERVQILHAHDIYSNVFAVPIARVAGVPGVIASRRWWHHAPRPSLIHINRQAYRFAHRVIANSAAVAGLLQREDKVAHARIAVVENFVDDHAFDSVTEQERLSVRRSWGVPDNAVAVGAVARLEPVKRLERLVDAVAAVGDPRLHLVLVGEGSQHALLKARSTALGISDRVHFTGQLPQQPNPHQFLEISALTSESEGFPNTLVEAMAAGRPTIATDVGGVADAVTDNETGMLVASGNAAELARKLGELAGDEMLRAKLGSTGRSVAFARYRAEATIGTLTEVYARLTGATMERST